jgi:hypothetical protein
MARFLATTSGGVCLMLLAWTACAKTPPTPCPPGTFRIDGAPLVPPARGRLIVLDAGTVELVDVCPPIAAKVRGSQRKTKVKALWPADSCLGIQGTVRLKAKIVSSCSLMRGTIRAGSKRKFEAPLNGTGESTTTTSTSTTITSTSVPLTTTTFQGALAPDFVMFTGAETGAELEVSSNRNCLIVGSPVHSGLRSCQIGIDSFAELQPAFSLETAHARVYHRIDVTTAPSTDAFAPVIVMDVAPQGITAADLVVHPDGTIAYALRDRLNGNAILGVSDPRPAGTWVRVEISTTIGAGTGEAELRLDGVPVVSVSDQQFGTQPLDRVFISNNAFQYGGNNGGAWTATFDDIAITANEFPGAGRIIRRQGAAVTPTYGQWMIYGAPTIEDAWSQTPPNAGSGATTPASGDPLTQTMHVAPFDQGVDPIAPGNTIKACQTWLNVGLTGASADRTYAVRRRVGGVDADTPLGGLTTDNVPHSDGVAGGFWRATLAELNASEIGAAKYGGAGGTGLRVTDAWLVCEYQ